MGIQDVLVPRIKEDISWILKDNLERIQRGMSLTIKIPQQGYGYGPCGDGYKDVNGIVWDSDDDKLLFWKVKNADICAELDCSPNGSMISFTIRSKDHIEQYMKLINL